MKIETKKVPVLCAGTSLIGVGDQRPLFWGNYFSLRVDGGEVRVLNMWWENLEHASKKYLKGDDVQVRLYWQAQDSYVSRIKSFCLIDDDRIPKDYYYNKLCFTGYGFPSTEAAKDMYEHLGDPDNEFEQFTDPVSYHKKRGGNYDPKTGIVSTASVGILCRSWALIGDNSK